MGRDSIGVWTGFLVFVAGTIAVVNLVGRSADPPVELPASVSTVTSPDLTTRIVTTEPELPRVGSAVTRVLRWSGNAGMANAEELAQIPPSVAALLVEYGVPLRVPTDNGLSN